MTTPITLAYSGVCPAPPGDARLLLRLSHKAKVGPEPATEITSR